MRAALELIAEQGYERTTATEIGARAGYSRAILRQRFGSKEDLLEALFASKWRPLLDFDPPVERNGLGQALAMLDHLLDILRDDPDLFKAFITVSLDIPNHLVELKPRYTEWWHRYEQQTADALRLGQRDGSIKADVDFGYEAKHVITFGVGLVYRWSMAWDDYDIVGAVTEWRLNLHRRLSNEG